MENAKFREKGIGKILYLTFVHLFYFLPILLSNLRMRHKTLLPLYKKKEETEKHKNVSELQSRKTVVYMALPETTFSGGLSDRLRGIVAIYAECKRKGLPFRLVFEPLHLQDYISPNEYDWRISDRELIWDTKKCYPCVLITYHANSKNRYQHFVQSIILKYFLHKDYQQIHVFSNMICRDDEYSNLYHELFKPTPELQKLIDYHLSQIGGKRSYVSCTFRFRQLLGDFREGGETLSDNEKETYIKRCINTVKNLHTQKPEVNILVTADSVTFLKQLEACQLPYVYIIPGKIVHIGFTFDANKQTYMKSFVDMYMLSYARTVYLVRDKKMYHSGFPYRAALLGKTEYKEIWLK